MSHGSTDKCEPNFVPLLDLVLQLVMFFMLCANFVMDQTSAEVKLPEAAAAKAIERDVNEVIFLNVDSKGRVLLTPDQRTDDESETLDNEIQVKSFMQRRAAVEKRKTGKDMPEAVLVLRVDRETPFDRTYGIMKACRDAGYTRVQLRAIQPSGLD
jgi:biopolymer transport protein ExbD